MSNHIFTVIFLAEMAIKVNLSCFIFSCLTFFYPQTVVKEHLNRAVVIAHYSVFSGHSSWLLLWESDLPFVQLEHFGWSVGVCFSDGHPGFSGLYRYKQDPRDSPSPSSSSHPSPSEVHFYLFLCTV